jgi:N-acetylglucosaminyldiphosphoundecaprenol N-acetyl-beta-D-mannosaminyltransferase
LFLRGFLVLKLINEKRKGKMIQKDPKNIPKGNLTKGRIIGKYWKIFDILLFSSNKIQVLSMLRENLILGTKKYWVATVNPEFVMETEKDSDFKKILQKTNLNVIDGVGLVWARELDARCKILDVIFLKKMIIGFKVGVEVLKGKYKDQIASGADLILDLVKMAKEKNKKFFLLGGWNGRAKKTAKYLKSEFKLKDDQIGWCEGEPNIANSEVVKKVNSFKPDVLLVAYGMKKQEFWIDENLKKLNVGIVIGVGRSFDYYSGELKRAPNWVRKMGMEWFYSLVKEPKRLKRQLVLPKFVWKVLKK